MKQLHWDQFCVMTTHYQQHTLEYTLDSIAANGFRNVELWGASPHYCYDDYTPSGRNARVQEICRMLKSRGLKMPVFTPEQLRQYTINIASSDTYVQKWSEDIMMRYLEDTVSCRCCRDGNFWMPKVTQTTSVPSSLWGGWLRAPHSLASPW